MTNREWLNSLSDEEMAERIDDWCNGWFEEFCKSCPASILRDGEIMCAAYEPVDSKCKKTKVEWLKAEHSEVEE